MNHSFSAAALIVAISVFVLAQNKPDYTGSWKLKSTESNEVLTIEHQEPKLTLKYKIEDQMGNRSFEVKTETDGKERKQEIQGAPATFIAKWEGSDLTIELKRNATFGVIHNRRKLKLTEDGKTITTERVDFSPEGNETFRRPEIWEKQ